MTWNRCRSTHRGLGCQRQPAHFGAHKGRSRIGGTHWEWNDPRSAGKTPLRTRPHPGPTIARRNAAKKRRAEKQKRRAANA